MKCEGFGRKLPWQNLLYIMRLVWVTESRPSSHRLHEVTSHKTENLTSLQGCLCTFWYTRKAAVSVCYPTIRRERLRKTMQNLSPQPFDYEAMLPTDTPSFMQLTDLILSGDNIKRNPINRSGIIAMRIPHKAVPSVPWIDALHTPVAPLRPPPTHTSPSVF